MLKEILGLPAHALLVHAAVVFIPLTVLFAILYAVLPMLRRRIDWATVVLAVVGPLAAYFAMESGEALKDVLISKRYPPEIIDKVTEHQGFGTNLFWWALGLGVATLLLTFVTSNLRQARGVPSWVGMILSAIVVVLGLITAWYVYKTGDSGAHIVWQGVL